ncbi:MAG TPA: VWA domain-containing protein [Thermoanaerobaculia bacterium]|nr:VWA domain-containing protein [Thermoanaerobaculia bacterium]
MKRLTIILLLTLFAPVLPAADEQKPLTRREQKERIAKLPEEHRQFLLDVEPVISEAERQAFLKLETDAQRNSFIDDFWRRRDKARGTTNHSAHDEYYEHLQFVRETFEQVASDRSRIYLIHGPPAAMIDIKCLQYIQPAQVWIYPYLPELGREMALLFFMRRGERQYRLWDPFTDGLKALETDDISKSANGSLRDVYRLCKDGEIFMGAVARMQAEQYRVHKVFTPPPVNEEDVNKMLRSAVVADPKAAKLAAEISISYPGAEGMRTDAQLTIFVPRAQLKTTTAGNASVYTIDVVGEVLRDEKLWEKYRYRFDFPGTMQDEKLPIVIDRMLRPATYRSRVKITDAASGAQAILENDLVVPVVEVKPTEESATLTALQDDLLSSRARLRIVPLPETVTSGVQTIQTLISGSGIKSVEFWLDGKKIAARRAPPYTLDLDFGTMPRARRVRAVALDAHGQIITGDEIVINTGTDPFRVRIASPRVAPKLSGPTKVEIDVRVPAGKDLEYVELYWNEQRVATMYDPPFVQTVNIPQTEGVGYLRAVAKLKEEESELVEDVVMVNTPEFMAEIDVHLIELPTTVLRDGKPVNGLAESSFKVFDSGQPVKLAKFEHVKDLPLSIGMAVDTSGSMDEKMAQARGAGASFFENVMKKGDKAFLVAFDSQPHIVQKWSGDLMDINSALAKLRAEESTALYDAVVYSLYNFMGVKGQKALVLLTDGKDTVSKFSFEQALEYAQRAAVPIYAIGIGIRAADLDVKQKLNRLCAETGGSTYYIDNASALTKIYSDIQSELRSQYVLGFYPPAEVKPGGKWREVTVQVAEGRAKTIRGYYP